jgi:hypothetical protein
MMISCYRIVYGIVVAVFLGNVLYTNYSYSAPHYMVALMIAMTGLLCGLLVLLIAFFRIRPAVSWVIVLAWEAFFIWYGWFSPSSPFALHELHTINPQMAASEASAHFERSTAIFVILFAWFLSLPIVQSAYSRRKESRP